MRLRAELRIRNADLIAARQEFGLSQIGLSTAVGVPISHICELEKLDFRKGKILYESARKIADHLGLEMALLYPPSLEGVAFPSSIVRYHEVESYEIAHRVERLNALPSPTDERDEVKRILRSLIPTLNEQQQAVLELRFGLKNGETYTYAAIGKILKLPRERIRQIEKRALRILAGRTNRVCRAGGITTPREAERKAEIIDVRVGREGRGQSRRSDRPEMGGSG